MKKQLLLAGIVLLLITSFAACKKETFNEKPLRGKMVGKWQVNKIEVTTTGGSTVTTNYTVNDYMDFKDTKTDDFELSLSATNRTIGSWTTLADDATLFLHFSAKDLDCKVTTITETKLQFTGTVVGSNPKVTETYYLSR